MVAYDRRREMNVQYEDKRKEVTQAVVCTNQ